jgi:hypothetical protein
MNKQLFKEDLLYCDGRQRPYFRGKIHLIACLTVFPIFIYLYYKTNCEHTFAFKVGMINLLIIYLAHIISSIYHSVPVSKENEIILQKMDIIGANWYIGSSYYPMAFLLFPKVPGYLLATLATIITIWNSICIWKSEYSIIQPILIVALQIPFFYYIYKYFTSYELICNFIGIGTLFIAAIFLIYEPHILFFNSSICTSYEIYHLLSVVCFMAILLMNYSIVCRSKNIQ